ncbi:YqeB family protein [Streptomyces platensis]|uniref:YqeB family protein n=1 Tax=Streptomyces platensis TaxID=58346 RepID=UPI003C2C292F
MDDQLAQRHRTDKSTALAQPAWMVALVCVALALLGAGAGWLIKILAEWLVALPWAPMQGPAELLASVPEPWRTVGLLATGTLLGVIVGLIAQYEELSVVVSAERITLTRKGKGQEFARDRVVQAFLDGKQLVLLGDDEGELAREACDLDVQRVADAFTAHGYAWLDEDPHKDDFRRWVPDGPGLPQGANALLKARAQLLEKKSSTGDLRELREELVRLGVVVRDEKRRQYWRLSRGRG